MRGATGALHRDLGVVLLVRLTGVRVVRVTLVHVTVRPHIHVLDVGLRGDRDDLHLALRAVIALTLIDRLALAAARAAAVLLDGDLRVLLLVRLAGVGVVRVALVDVAAREDVDVLDVELRSDGDHLGLTLVARVLLRAGLALAAALGGRAVVRGGPGVLLLGRLAGIEVETDVRFRERSFGVREGLTMSEAWEQFPEHMARWLAGDEAGIPGSESSVAAGERFTAGLHEHLATLGPEQMLVVVSHGGVTRAV